MASGLRRVGRAAAAFVAVAVLAGATPAVADDAFHARRAGHPLRVLAYVVHPIGVILERLIFRPAHWLARYQPIKTLVGHTD